MKLVNTPLSWMLSASTIFAIFSMNAKKGSLFSWKCLLTIKWLFIYISLSNGNIRVANFPTRILKKSTRLINGHMRIQHLRCWYSNCNRILKGEMFSRRIVVKKRSSARLLQRVNYYVFTQYKTCTYSFDIVNGMNDTPIYVLLTSIWDIKRAFSSQHEFWVTKAFE